MKFSIVMPTLANHKYFVDACKHVISNTHEKFEFIIVYNGEQKRIAEVKDIISNFNTITLVTAPQRSGIAKAYNLGFSNSRGQFIAFLHDDVIIEDNLWLNKLQGVLDKHHEIGLVGGSEPKYIDRSPKEIDMLYHKEGILECDWAPTISLTRREYIEDGCIFDEFYLIGIEDKDWALSFRRKGLKVAFYPVKHKHIGCQGSYTLFRHDRELLDYYSKEGIRERYFIQKNKDVLKQKYYEQVLNKWRHKDRDWRKKWWKELYFKYYWEKIKSYF